MRKKTSRFRWAVGLPVGNAFAEPEVSTGLRHAFIRTLVSLQLIVTSRAPSTIRRNLAFQDTANICKKTNNPIWIKIEQTPISKKAPIIPGGH